MNFVFWKPKTGRPNASRSRVYLSVCSTASSIAATAPNRDDELPFEAAAHQLNENLTLGLAQEVRAGNSTSSPKTTGRSCPRWLILPGGPWLQTGIRRSVLATISEMPAACPDFDLSWRRR